MVTFSVAKILRHSLLPFPLLDRPAAIAKSIARFSDQETDLMMPKLVTSMVGVLSFQLRAVHRGHVSGIIGMVEVPTRQNRRMPYGCQRLVSPHSSNSGEPPRDASSRALDRDS